MCKTLLVPEPTPTLPPSPAASSTDTPLALCPPPTARCGLHRVGGGDRMTSKLLSSGWPMQLLYDKK